jgi:hypothetical protein
MAVQTGTIPYEQLQHWSSGYDVRLTRGRSPVQSWDAVLFFGFVGWECVRLPA